MTDVLEILLTDGALLTFRNTTEIEWSENGAILFVMKEKEVHTFPAHAVVHTYNYLEDDK